MIELIEKSLGYSYTGFRNGYHVFTKHYMRQTKKSYHYYFVTTCSKCGGEYWKRKGMKATMHNACHLEIVNARKGANK